MLADRAVEEVVSEPLGRSMVYNMRCKVYSMSRAMV